MRILHSNIKVETSETPRQQHIYSTLTSYRNTTMREATVCFVWARTPEDHSRESLHIERTLEQVQFRHPDAQVSSEEAAHRKADEGRSGAVCVERAKRSLTTTVVMTAPVNTEGECNLSCIVSDTPLGILLQSPHTTYDGSSAHRRAGMVSSTSLITRGFGLSCLPRCSQKTGTEPLV